MADFDIRYSEQAGGARGPCETYSARSLLRGWRRARQPRLWGVAGTGVQMTDVNRARVLRLVDGASSPDAVNAVEGKMKESFTVLEP